jgi:hypothetical protein
MYHGNKCSFPLRKEMGVREKRDGISDAWGTGLLAWTSFLHKEKIEKEWYLLYFQGN